MSEQQPDAFRGLVDGHDVVVEFGRRGPGQVTGSTRVVLPAETARRLVARLGEALSRFAPAALAADAATRGTTPLNAPPDPAGDRAALTLHLAAGLGAPRNQERSFRVAHGSLSANRFLVTLDPRDIPGDSGARVLEACRQLGMPAHAIAAAAARIGEAACVHFGFEDNGGKLISKFYLEFPLPRDVPSVSGNRADGIALYLAFKWGVDATDAVVSHYTLLPGLSPADIEARMATLYPGDVAQPSFDIARSVLRLAAARLPAGTLPYLEVSEEGTARRSWDLNCYDAGLHLRDIQEPLFAMRDRFGIRPGQFQAFYDQVRASRFGHLAGGVHRDGSDFFNVYYGVSGYPRVVGGS